MIEKAAKNGQKLTSVARVRFWFILWWWVELRGIYVVIESVNGRRRVVLFCSTRTSWLCLQIHRTQVYATFPVWMSQLKGKI